MSVLYELLKCFVSKSAKNITNPDKDRWCVYTVLYEKRKKMIIMKSDIVSDIL